MWAPLASSTSAAPFDGGDPAGGGAGVEDLELGLSLSGARRCRILTAGEFRPPPAAVRPSSSSSSVSSSSGGPDAMRQPLAAAPAAPADANRNDHPSSSPVVVGWPPVRVFRMNSFSNASACSKKPNHADIIRAKDERSSAADGVANEMDRKKSHSNSTFVKVNMDGDPIGRKVNLSAHGSYQNLVCSLESMFKNGAANSAGGSQPLKLLANSSEFALTYEDKDGDWMLVGDVPWSMFVGTAKRLRIMRTSDTSGIGLKQ